MTAFQERVAGWSSVIMAATSGLVAQANSTPDSVVGQIGAGGVVASFIVALGFLMNQAKEPIATWLTIVAQSRETVARVAQLTKEKDELTAKVDSIRVQADAFEVAAERLRRIEAAIARRGELPDPEPEGGSSWIT